MDDTFDNTTLIVSEGGGGSGSGNNSPTGMKLKVPTHIKPALKTADDYYNDDDDDDDDDMHQRNEKQRKKPAGNNKKKSKKNRTLKWDEDKIKEHDQLRGTRMKIDEPNTPFAHYDSGSETDGSFSSLKGQMKSGDTQANQAISWDTLTNKLEAHAAVKDQVYPPSSPSASSSRGNVTTDDEGSLGGGDHHQQHQLSEENQKREAQKAELKRLEFQELRKRHYNEMEVVRRFRREHPDGVPTNNGTSTSSNDDEENDGDDENE
jgi:protein phosphatase inhibitor 2